MGIEVSGRYRHIRAQTPGAVPTASSLLNDELAVDTNHPSGIPKGYMKDANDVVHQVFGVGGSKAITATSTPKTADFNATAGTLWIIDGSSAVITATLPATPADQDIVGFADVGTTWEANEPLINPNGKSIETMAAGNMTCSANIRFFYLQWNAALNEWRFV